YLVDSLALPNEWQHPVLVQNANIFLGRDTSSASGASLGPRLDTWAVSDAGRFVQLGAVKLPVAISDLAVFPGLLAAQAGWNRVMLFDHSDPALLRLMADGPSTGCANLSLRYSDGSGARGLWLPWGAYGVLHIWKNP
ncbi:MAG: hypothetical protein NTW03_18170, partial [Verrucomicrobia bacterium]|nr:hypothetical protein [Verrucomicrobiota bacterium]